jgi:hypothetical protein
MRQLVEQVFSTLHRLKERRAELKAPQAILYPPRAGFDSPKTRSSKLQENGHGTGASAGLLKSNERAAAAVGGSKGSPGYDEDSFLCSLLSSQFLSTGSHHRVRTMKVFCHEYLWYVNYTHRHSGSDASCLVNRKERSQRLLLQVTCQLSMSRNSPTQSLLSFSPLFVHFS